MFRISASSEFADPLPTIKNEWTTGDLAHAHMWLDAIQAAQSKAMEHLARG